MVVAYRDREPSIVRPDEVDHGALPAANLQRLPFTSIRGLVPRF